MVDEGAESIGRRSYASDSACESSSSSEVCSSSISSRSSKSVSSANSTKSVVPYSQSSEISESSSKISSSDQMSSAKISSSQLLSVEEASCPKEGLRSSSRSSAAVIASTVETASDEGTRVGSVWIALAGAANAVSAIKEPARHKQISCFNRFIAFLSFCGIVFTFSCMKIAR